MHLDELLVRLPDFMRTLEREKAKISLSALDWYPYGTLHNLEHISKLLTGEARDLATLAGSRRIADIGAADGDLAFFLEHAGADVDVIDWAPTNYNGLRGVRALRDALGSQVRVHEVDLDSQFGLPEVDYGLVLFLGILYHLKNPFFVLEALSRCADWCILSTRVARRTPDGGAMIGKYPLAYLVGETELNNDNTNYWIFSEEGLRRILHRTGWVVEEYVTVGDTITSDPVNASADERAFCLVRSSSRT